MRRCDQCVLETLESYKKKKKKISVKKIGKRNCKKKKKNIAGLLNGRNGKAKRRDAKKKRKWRELE